VDSSLQELGDNLRNKVALSFVNDQAASTHANVRVDSIFLSPSGEWRLGGFEVLSNPKDESAVLYVRPP
jgi:SCY1-like protein 1